MNSNSPAEEDQLSAALEAYISAHNQRKISRSLPEIWRSLPRWRKYTAIVLAPPFIIFCVAMKLYIPLAAWALFMTAVPALERRFSSKYKNQYVTAKNHAVDELISLAKQRSGQEGKVTDVEAVIHYANGALYDRKPLERSPEQIPVLIAAVQERLRHRSL